MKRKRISKYPADPSAMWRVISNVTTYDPADIAAVDNRGRIAFEKMRSGAGSESDYDELVHTLNTAAKRLIALGITESIVISNAAAEAMFFCRERYERTGHLGFDGPGMQAVMAALDLHTQVLEVSTEGEMMRAHFESLKALGMI